LVSFVLSSSKGLPMLTKKMLGILFISAITVAVVEAIGSIWSPDTRRDDSFPRVGWAVVRTSRYRCSPPRVADY